MPDNLAVIRRVIQEHQILYGNIKTVGDSMNDMDATFNLQKLYSLWAQSSMEVLAEKQAKLKQSMKLLDDGMRNHFSFEEEALPPLFGEILMDALRLEHRNIIKKLDDVKAALAETNVGEMAPEQLLTRKSQIQQLINTISQTTQEHAGREEVILTMIKNSLEEKQQHQSQ